MDIDSDRCRRSAAELLRRHKEGDTEANITSAVRDFLIETKLANAHEINEEIPPADASRRAVDLETVGTFVEIKRRVNGSRRGFNPDPEAVRQLDEYLAASEKAGKGVRTGLLTDGKYWLLRWPNAGEPNTRRPYAFVLESADRWFVLFEWLRDEALEAFENLPPEREEVASHFGPRSPLYAREISYLDAIFAQYKEHETLKIKRRLWFDLLRTALGEIARDEMAMDSLFVRHTYLSAIIGMVVQAGFGIDIRAIAEEDPSDLIHGREFRNKTGLQGVLESDFFVWLTEVGGDDLLRAMARRVDRFDWLEGGTPNDIAAILYETVIPPEERRTLGEYYTPQWLARTMTKEIVDDPLDQRVLDPACGSGTFLAEAVTHYIAAARRENVDSSEIFTGLRNSVVGIDVHPVAVHLARAAYALAAREAIQDAAYTQVSIPVYLGDALQLRFRSGDMFASKSITIEVGDELNTELVFPRNLVKRAGEFDSLMSEIAELIEVGQDPTNALNHRVVQDTAERSILEETIHKMQRLHDVGSNHIWAYYTRNMVRPVALAEEKVDVIIGNPPWLNYRNTTDALREALEDQSKNLYDIWQGGRYATHQDIAGLFFTRCVDLYLRQGGAIGMVMPHSALQAGQYAKWRSGTWRGRRGSQGPCVDLQHKTAWDLERLEPNTFFPIPASVVFALNNGIDGAGHPLGNTVERWSGQPGSDTVERRVSAITDEYREAESVYSEHSRQGASIVPRRLFFVDEIENKTLIRRNNSITVNPRISSQDKAPWNAVNLRRITNETIEREHVFEVYLGETVVPYGLMPPLLALLPVKQGDGEIYRDASDEDKIDYAHLMKLMRFRWQKIDEIWEANKSPNNRLSLIGQIDYYGKLTSQLAWQTDAGDRPIRIVYGAAGRPTAARVESDEGIIESKLFWVTCQTVYEAQYLLALINSNQLESRVYPLMSKGLYGARDLQKHLWRLPIPEFDADDPLHCELSEAGANTETEVKRLLSGLQEERSDNLTYRIARREIRAWLNQDTTAQEIERMVGELLADS